MRRFKVKGFNELSYEAMGDTIKQIFGEATSELISTVMKRQVLTKHGKVGEKIEASRACLEQMFGPEGTQIIQAISLKRLRLKMHREYDEVERYFSICDKLFEIKFKLLSLPSAQESSVRN